MDLTSIISEQETRRANKEAKEVRSEGAKASAFQLAHL